MLDFPLVVAVSDDASGDYEFESRDANVVILTQSCDIPKPAQYSLIVAEVHEYEFLVKSGMSHLQMKDYKRGLARGTAVSDFLLPPSEHFGWSIVGFRDVHIVPKQLVARQHEEAGSLRLASPYREYLSQAFARFIMRVGLPQTLSQFEKA